MLVAVYLAIVALGDARAGLISDSGGKLATARVMAEGRTLSPDVGYWAEDFDPDGWFHPLANTVRVGDRWVQATSLPYAATTAGLWAVAGPLGVTLLSVAGGVAAALAARHLARQLGARGDIAFWIVGLASPLAVYAVDAWEHAPAAGLALWGIALALEADRPTRAAAAGALLAAALLLRAEVGASVISFAVACLCVGEVRRRWTRRPGLLGAGVLAAGSLLLANAVLERWLLDAGVRDARASSGALDAGSELGRRATDAVVTGAGLLADETATGIAVALVLAAALLVLTLALAGRLHLSPAATRGVTALVVALYGVRLLDGWANVPGVLAAVPVIVLAVTVTRTPPVRVLLGTALGAVPLVWAVQWKGGHILQWGGRYLLVPTLLLLVLAAVALEGPVRRRLPARVLLGVTIAVGALGLGWHIQRTDVVADQGEALDALPADTVVVTNLPHLGRELGAWYDDRRWLSADDASLEAVVALAREVAPPTIAVVRRPPTDGTPLGAPSIVGYRLTDTWPLAALGGDLQVQVLVRD